MVCNQTGMNPIPTEDDECKLWAGSKQELVPGAHTGKGEACNSMLGVHLAAGKTRVTNDELVTDWVESCLVERAGMSAGFGTWP